MAQKTYLQLVNEAMAEAKVSVDPLTSSDFATNTSHLLYSRFKKWVNAAYEELFMDRREWLFRKERAVVTIWPRLYMGAMTYTPSPGDVLVGASSGTIVTVKSVHTFEDAEQSTPLELTLSVEFDATTPPRNLIMRETFNRTSPTAATGVGYLIGPGRYEFSAIVEGLEAIDYDTVRVHRTPANAAAAGSTMASNSDPVIALPWIKWQSEFELYPWAGELPQYISETPQGSYALFPQPEGESLISFDYTQGVKLMSLHSDVPSALPARYHDYLLYAALEKFADWDRQPQLWAYARKHAEKYRNWLELYEMPEIGIVGWNGVIKRG